MRLEAGHLMVAQAEWVSKSSNSVALASLRCRLAKAWSELSATHHNMEPRKSLIGEAIGLMLLSITLYMPSRKALFWAPRSRGGALPLVFEQKPACVSWIWYSKYFILEWCGLVTFFLELEKRPTWTGQGQGQAYIGSLAPSTRGASYRKVSNYYYKRTEI